MDDYIQYQQPSRGTSVMYALEYLIGLAIFGLIWWLFNGILPTIGIVSVKDDVYTLTNYLWGGSIIFYLVMGMFYFWRRIKEWIVYR